MARRKTGGELTIACANGSLNLAVLRALRNGHGPLGPHHQPVEGTVAVRDGADEHLEGPCLTEACHFAICRENVARVHHADAVDAVRAVKDGGTLERGASCPLLRGV